MPVATPEGVRYLDAHERFLSFNLHDPQARERLRAALCGKDDTFERVVEVRGPADIGKGYLLESATVAAGELGHPWTLATLDLDGTSPEGVDAGLYADKLLTQLRQGRTARSRRAAERLQALIGESKVNLQLKPPGWDQLAWLPIAIELELALGTLKTLLDRHLPPDQSRPAPEHFIETLREIAVRLGERGRGLVLQVQEQRQPEASVRDLLLSALPALPALVVAFTQSDTSGERDYQGLDPLRLQLRPFTADELAQRIRAGLGDHDLPHSLLHAVATRAQGIPGRHPDLAFSHAELGGTLDALGRYEEASVHEQKALAILRATLPPSHHAIASVLHKLGSTLHRLGRQTDALASHKEALAIFREALPVGHPVIAVSLNSVALDQRELRRPDLSEPLLREAVGIDDAALPPDSLTRVHDRNHLAIVLLMLDRLPEAGEILATAWTIANRRCDLTSARVLASRIALAFLAGEPAGHFFGQLRTLLDGGPLPARDDIYRTACTDAVRAALCERLDPQESALLDAILDRIYADADPAGLEAFPAWRNQAPLPLDLPWPEPPGLSSD